MLRVAICFQSAIEYEVLGELQALQLRVDEDDEEILDDTTGKRRSLDEEYLWKGPGKFVSSAVFFEPGFPLRVQQKHLKSLWRHVLITSYGLQNVARSYLKSCDLLNFLTKFGL